MTSRDPTEPLPIPINPATWDRLVTLFTEAIALPPTDRAAWVAALVDGTPEFRRELAAMVAAHAPEAALTLERELLDRQDASEMSAGTRIGAYLSSG